jgi:hypothetical protein
MLRICAHPDCTTMTLGTLCVAHEAPVEVAAWPRGRPYSRRERRLPAGAAQVVAADEEPTPAGASAVSFGGDTAP